MKLVAASLSLLSQIFFSTQAHAQRPIEPRSRVVFLYAGLMAKSQFDPYRNNPRVLDSTDLTIPIDPFHFDHESHYRALTERLDSFAGGGEVVLVGYSVGGKFAARMAAEFPRVRGTFLIDPVDGGSPVPFLEGIFDLFVRGEEPSIFTPTHVVRSEYGERAGPFGFPCVPPGVGAAHFARAVSPGFLEVHDIAGAGHLDFLGKPFPLGYQLARAVGCAPGAKDSAEVVSRTSELWERFLERLWP